MLLYLMRHGAAEDTAPSGRDADRSLTPAGRTATRRVALALRDARVRPIGRIISSPLARAQQTAEIMRSILRPEIEIEVDEDLSPDGSAFDLAVRMALTPGDVLLVGHQPNIEMVARGLSRRHAHSPNDPSSGPRLPTGFRTATIVGFLASGGAPPYPLALVLDPNHLAGG